MNKVFKKYKKSKFKNIRFNLNYEISMTTDKGIICLTGYTKITQNIIDYEKGKLK